MTADSRAFCPECGRCVQVRLDGALRLHRDEKRRGCPGGGIDHEAVAAEAARLATAEADCSAVGLDHLWVRVAEADHYSVAMVRDMLAAVARYFVETGMTATSDAA